MLERCLRGWGVLRRGSNLAQIRLLDPSAPPHPGTRQVVVVADAKVGKGGCFGRRLLLSVDGVQHCGSSCERSWGQEMRSIHLVITKVSYVAKARTPPSRKALRPQNHSITTPHQFCTQYSKLFPPSPAKAYSQSTSSSAPFHPQPHAALRLTHRFQEDSSKHNPHKCPLYRIQIHPPFTLIQLPIHRSIRRNASMFCRPVARVLRIRSWGWMRVQ